MATTDPMYISAHSAEAILSDLRPLKLQTDALTFLNLLLDDILANIISTSRSILTDRLKTGLLKTIPTTIGKDALLEAEMELRAYWQRPNAVKPSPSQLSASEYSFSLPSMIELMRLKCEAYSTLNDMDEDPQAENSIQERLRAQGMEPPKSIITAPAALYLTAILECICERILSSVGRVATRDSSKDAAGTNDLFVALCEDDAVYPIFKSSKIYDVIENSLKYSSKPQRSRSFPRSERLDTRDTQSADPLSQSWTRLSSESAASGALSGSAGSDNYALRTSIEKGKAIKLFRPSTDRDATIMSDASSRISASRKGFGAQSDGNNDNAFLDSEEGNVMQDFDDLMRSGDTMKVSLTPDRLRTMETVKQQQRQLQNTRRTGRIAPADHSRTLSAADADGRQPPLPDQQQHGARKPSLSHVDSIIEDEEPKETVVSPQAVQSRSVLKPSDVRTRSVSTSGISPSISPRNPRKSSLSSKSPPPSYNAPNTPSATPRRTRKIQRNRESMDIDDIMNGSEGSESSPDPGDQPTQGRVPLYPVSKATKDLISFLEEGPPPEVQPTRPATVSSVSLTPTTKSAKSGSRLQRMLSKLSLSKEDRIFQDTQRARGVGSASAPSTPLVASVRSLGTSNLPPLPTSPRPAPPPILSIPTPAPISPPPSSQPSPDDDARSPIARGGQLTRKMSARKAVPTWEERASQRIPTPPAKDTPSPRPLLTSSSPASPTSPSPTPNGLAQPQSPPTPAPEAKEANGHAHDNHKSPRSDSPVPVHTPAPTGLETPSHSPTFRGNGNGLAEKPYSQPISPPRSQPDHRLSMNGKQVNSAQQFSGYQPQPPSAQPIAPIPSLSESLALDLRKLMSQATTADECRLLLDTFLTRAGITSPPSPSVSETTPSDEDSLEKTLVHHFLGADPDDSQPPSIHVVTTEAERHSPASTAEHPQDQGRDILHPSQSPTTPMEAASAVHAHHVASVPVAVVS